MILNAALLLRAASGVMFLGVGLILVWVAGRDNRHARANWAIALTCAGFGAGFIAINLLATDPTLAVAGLMAQLVFSFIALVTVVWFMMAGRLRVHVRYIDLLIGLVSVVAAFAFAEPKFSKMLFDAQAFPRDVYEGAAILVWRADAFAMIPLLGAFSWLTVSAARAHGAAQDVRERTGWALLAIGFFAYPSFMAGLTLSFASQDPAAYFAAATMCLLVAIAAIAWFRRAPIVTILILGTTFIGQLGPISGIYVLGVGILRIAAAALVALAMLRYGLAGADHHRPAAHRGTLAAGALATLFIVAQIAQEFFAAKYGLLMGGVVAGTLLFAANPIQRAMERLAGHESGGDRPHGGPKEPSRPDSMADREKTYMEAVQLALRDRTLTREEEWRLLRLAYHLGVPTPRAMEIYDELEREASRGPV